MSNKLTTEQSILLSNAMTSWRLCIKMFENCDEEIKIYEEQIKKIQKNKLQYEEMAMNYLKTIDELNSINH